MISYYAYEYEVLMELNDKYKIKDINIEQETRSAYKTFNLEEVKVATVVVGESITLNFDNNFKVCLDRDNCIRLMYANGVKPDVVVANISKIIDDTWLRKIIKE